MGLIIGLVSLMLGRSAVPVVIEKPTATPVPTISIIRPTTKPVVTCDKFKTGGRVVVEVDLKSSDFKGATLVEIKPAATCGGVVPNGKISDWMQPGVLTWTSPELSSGRYVLVIANGNYQGVITQNVEGVNGRYVMSVGITKK